MITQFNQPGAECLLHRLETAGDAAVAQFVGGKAANLARLISLAVPVPEGVVIGREHFDRFVADNGLDAHLAAQSLDLNAPHSFNVAAQAMRRAVKHAEEKAKTSTFNP